MDPKESKDVSIKSAPNGIVKSEKYQENETRRIEGPKLENEPMTPQEKTNIWLNRNSKFDEKSIHEKTIEEPVVSIQRSRSVFDNIKETIKSTIQKSPLKKMTPAKKVRLSPEEDIVSEPSINPSWDELPIVQNRRALRPRKRIDYKAWLKQSNKDQKPYK